MAQRDLADQAQQAVTQQKERTEQAAEKPITSLLARPWLREQLQKQLGPNGDAGAFIRSVVTSVRNAPQLELCDPASILGGIFTAAQLHLEIGSGLGQAYLIPRQNWRDRDDASKHHGWQASFQIGYPGLLALSYRTGVITGANAELVKVGDTFKRGSNSERGPFYDLEYGAEHDEPETPIMGVLGFFWTVGSERPVWRYLTIDQVESRRPEFTKERSGKDGPYTPNTPWKTNYPQMVEKTGLINALRFAPKSATLALATSLDEAVLLASRERPNEIEARREDRAPEHHDLGEQSDET